MSWKLSTTPALNAICLAWNKVRDPGTGAVHYVFIHRVIIALWCLMPGSVFWSTRCVKHSAVPPKLSLPTGGLQSS